MADDRAMPLLSFVVPVYRNERTLTELVERLRAGIKVADMGCGKGYLTFGAWQLFSRQLSRPVRILGVEQRAEQRPLVDRVADEISVSQPVGLGRPVRDRCGRRREHRRHRHRWRRWERRRLRHRERGNSGGRRPRVDSGS